MAQRTRLTNNSDETDISSLISGDNIFSIPYFQRPYKWKQERIGQLNSDIKTVVDEDDSHFLGAIIVHGRRTNPSDPDVFDVIDGQQRLTTIFLYLCAAVKLLCDNQQYPEASSLFFKYLVINRPTGSLSNLKLHSCKTDRKQLNRVLNDIVGDALLQPHLGGFKFKPLLGTGEDDGTLWKNYKTALKFLRDEFDQGSLERVRLIYRAILEKISVVQIDVWDPTNGPKIFNSLNSKQEPMTTGDLVRNEIFSRVADQNLATIERVDSDFWQPFYSKFEGYGTNLFDDYFFPYGLIQKPSIRKSEVYSSLRKDWLSVSDPEIIIQQLSMYQPAFLDLHSGGNSCGHSPKVADAFRRFYLFGAPSATFPFVMQLSKAVGDKNVSDEKALEALAVVESFLIRRAVVGFEPTGLHAVFKRLWADCAGDLSAASVTKNLVAHKTVPWPTDEMLRNSIETRPLYKVGIAGFLITEYDKSLNGDCPSDKPEIEHVLPVNPEVSWFQVFSDKQHATYKDVLANLLPLSSKLNQSVSNKPYIAKRHKYQQDAMYKSARSFAEKYETWTLDDLVARGKILSAWAVGRWAFGPS